METGFLAGERAGCCSSWNGLPGRLALWPWLMKRRNLPLVPANKTVEAYPYQSGAQGLGSRRARIPQLQHEIPKRMLTASNGLHAYED
jgi:hypothetical protein